MRHFSFLAVSALIWAALVGGSRAGKHRHKCLSKADAKEVIDNYQKLIANYSAPHAEKYIADGFIEYSDSINSLLNITLGSPTFPTKAAFIKAQSANPSFPIVVQSVEAIECDTIVVIWTVAFGQAQKTVRGLTSIHASRKGDIWQIARMDVEFNSLTWLLNIGGMYQLPARPSFR
jgi:hypothetical protein